MKPGTSPYFRELNFNPFRKRLPDCAVRAVCAGLKLRYARVCRELGVPFKVGKGMDTDAGIDLEDIKRKFAPYFDVVEDAKEASWENRPEEFADMPFDPEFDLDEDLGIDLNDFCEIYRNQGMFLVALTNTDEVRQLTGEVVGHIVYCNLTPGSQYFIDTWDSSSLMVQAFMRIKKRWEWSDPDSLLYKKWLERHPGKAEAPSGPLGTAKRVGRGAK